MKVPIIVNLLLQITGFPKAGVDPSHYFKKKYNDKKLDERLKKKYDVVRDKHTYVIRTINDKEAWATTELLAVKVVCKNIPNQCTSGFIECVK